MRGKKTEPETVYGIMASYAVTGNVRETARALGMSFATVNGIIKANKNKPEFVQLRSQKRDDFAESANRIIDKGLRIIEMKMDIALDDEIGLREQSLREIVTAVGTLYDKRALALGNSTQNTTVSFSLPKDMIDYAE